MKTYLVYTYGGECTEVKADAEYVSADRTLTLTKSDENSTTKQSVAVFIAWNHFVVKEAS